MLAVVFLALLITGGPEGKVSLNEGELQTSGMYSIKVNLDEVTGAVFSENIPYIRRKVNAFDTFKTKKGTYMLDELGETRLFVNSLQGPFIILQTKDQPIILNYRDPEKTKQLYEKLTIELGK